ncbi:MAG: hypothetical protein ACRD45_21760, partial [Bryobacteraceae bacterium]
FNAPQRPSQPPERDHLLFLFLAQNIAHADAGYPTSESMSWIGLPLAGFWLITEAFRAQLRFVPRKVLSHPPIAGNPITPSAEISTLTA